jgi:hypothetical protein
MPSLIGKATAVSISNARRKSKLSSAKGVGLGTWISGLCVEYKWQNYVALDFCIKYLLDAKTLSISFC